MDRYEIKSYIRSNKINDLMCLYNKSDYKYKVIFTWNFICDNDLWKIFRNPRYLIYTIDYSNWFHIWVKLVILQYQKWQKNEDVFNLAIEF